MSPVDRSHFSLRALALTVLAAVGLMIVSAAPASAVTVGGAPSIKGAGTVTNDAVSTSSRTCDATAATTNATETPCAGGSTYSGSPYASITYAATPKAGGHWKFVRWVSNFPSCAGSTSPVCTISHVGDQFAQAHYTVQAVFEDKTGPTLTPSVTYSTVNDRTVTITWSADETLSASACALDGGPFSACAAILGSGPLSLSEGQHTFVVRGTDVAGGNVGADAPLNFKVVDTALVGGPGTASNQTSQTFTFSSVAGTVFECSVDNVVVGDCGAKGAGNLGSKTFTGLVEGTHTFRVRARAGADFDRVPVVATWTVDLTPPTVALTPGFGPGEGALQAADRETFRYASNEKGSTYECRLDAAAFAPCTSEHTLENLRPGAHRFEVRAVDVAGNVSAVVVRNWSVAAQDRDGDGFNSLIDCNDNDVAIRPGAIEIKGNDVDENCDGLIEALPQTPEGGQAPGGVQAPQGATTTPAGKPTDAKVIVNATATKSLTRFKTLTVDKVPAGATVSVTCKGAGCPKSLKKKGVSKTLPTGGKLVATQWVKTLRPGAVLTITVSLGTQKATTTIKVRAGKKPKITTR